MSRADWMVCRWCPEHENHWPPAAFAAWAFLRAKGGSRTVGVRPICNACVFERYARVYRPCRTCGGVMYFHSKQSTNPFPQCRKCVAKQVPSCSRCREDLRDRPSIDGHCLSCARHHLGITPAAERAVAA